MKQIFKRILFCCLILFSSFCFSEFGGSDKGGGTKTSLVARLNREFFNKIRTIIFMATPSEIDTFAKDNELNFYDRDFHNELIEEIDLIINNKDRQIKIKESIPECWNEKNVMACTVYKKGSPIEIAMDRAEGVSNYELVHMFIHEISHHIQRNNKTLGHSTNSKGLIFVDLVATGILENYMRMEPVGYHLFFSVPDSVLNQNEFGLSTEREILESCGWLKKRT